MQGVILEFSPSEQKVISKFKTGVRSTKTKAQVCFRYAQNVSESVSQLMNTIIGGFPGQTIAARAERNKDHPLWNALRRLLNVLFSPRTKAHCENAIQRDLERSKAILSIRKPFYRV